jgi:hypothetical protein
MDRVVRVYKLFSRVKLGLAGEFPAPLLSSYLCFSICRQENGD